MLDIMKNLILRQNQHKFEMDILQMHHIECYRVPYLVAISDSNSHPLDVSTRLATVPSSPPQPHITSKMFIVASAPECHVKLWTGRGWVGWGSRGTGTDEWHLGVEGLVPKAHSPRASCLVGDLYCSVLGQYRRDSICDGGGLGPRGGGSTCGREE